MSIDSYWLLHKVYYTELAEFSYQNPLSLRTREVSPGIESIRWQPTQV